MKIAILSMQRVINFGSVLQAYSLKNMISELSNKNVDFIDIDRSNNIPCNKTIDENEDYTIPVMMPKGILQRIKRKIFRELVKRNNKKIESFMYKELAINDTNNSKTYDCVVVGSDEVFNNSKGVSLQLYGDIKQASKVISYAASCGTAIYEEIPENKVEVIRRAMKNYSAMSVRDHGTEKYIGRLYDGFIERNFDPVLIGDLYKKEHRRVYLKKYMIIYAYGQRIRTSEEIDAIQTFARKRNIKTLAIGGSQFWCDYYIPMDPIRILDYFYFADYVVTDTFHGTIFSVINKKKFATIIRKTNQNKLTGLLEDLGLEQRRIGDMRNLETILTNEIDYTKVEIILEKERCKAKDYLSRNLKR